MTSGLDPDILQQIRTILRRDLKLDSNAPLPEEMPFLGSEVDLDSLDILLLVTSIERQFNLRIPNEAVGKSVFQNVASLTRFVQEHRQRPAQTAATEAENADWLAKLPHGQAFRFVTRVLEVRPGETARGTWIVRGDEPFLAGHFPGNPIVPGVLIAEALAQLSGLAGPAETGAVGRLAQVDVRFLSPAVPPVEIELNSKLLRVLGPLQNFEVTARVGATVVASGSIALSRPVAEGRT